MHVYSYYIYMWDKLLSSLCYKVFRIKLHNFISSLWPISFNILQILVSKTVNKIWIWVSFCFKYTLVIWNLTFAVSCFMAPVHEEEIEFLNCDFFLNLVCSFIFRSEQTPNGTFTSPNFPGLYPRNTECHYLFYGRTNERIHITFPYFDVEGIPPA